MSQTGLEGASAITASQSREEWEGGIFGTTPLQDATLAVLIRRTYIRYELAGIEGEKSLAERLRPLQERIASVPRTGLEADKDFYDDLSRNS